MHKRNKRGSGYSTPKRLVQVAISLGYLLIDNLWTSLAWVVGRKRKTGCIIFYYHGVPNEVRAQFAHQMDILIRWASPIRIDGAAYSQEGSRNAAVTFDDGFESVARNALPELAIRNIPSTIFVITNCLGRAPDWQGYTEQTMSAAELKRLPTDLVSIGSHTMTHPFLPSLSEEEAQHEIDDSRKYLQQVLDRQVTMFSFPYGGFNERLIKICRDAGYERVFTTQPVPGFKYATGRVWASPEDWPIEFWLKLLGAYRWMPIAIMFKRQLTSCFAAPLSPGQSATLDSSKINH